MKKFLSGCLIFLLAVLVIEAQQAKPKPKAKSKSKPKVSRPARIQPRTELITAVDDEPPPIPKEASQNQTGITIERHIVNYEVNPNGTATQTLETQWRFRNTPPILLERFNKTERAFNAALEEAEVTEAFLLKANGEKIKILPAAIQIKPTPLAEAAPALTSLKLISIDFGKIENGDATFYKLRITEKKSILEGNFSMIEVLPTVFEWKSAEINLSAPADFPLFIENKGFEGGKTGEENGRVRWKWTKKDTPAKKFGIGNSAIVDSSPLVAATSFPDYETLGAAYWAEAAKRVVVTPEIQKLSDELTKNTKDDKEKVYAIYEWANRNIRYYSVILERSGWQPNSAASILENRYGDCKDYTTLLQTLLQAQNIESHPVLIRAEEDVWFPEIAVPEFFNHAILYVPSLNMFADATAANTRFGILPQILFGKKALLAGAKNGLIKLPEATPEDNQILSETNLVFNADGGLKATSTNIYNGSMEILFRGLFADMKRRTSDVVIRGLLSYYGLSGTGKIIEISDPYKSSEPFQVKIEAELKDYTTFVPKGSVGVPVGINLSNVTELAKLTAPTERTTDFSAGVASFEEKYTFTFPAEIKILKIPAAVKFENEAGSYILETKTENNTVTLFHKSTIKKPLYTPVEYPQLRKLVEKIIDGYGKKIEYSAPSAFLRNKSAKIKKNPPAKKTSPFDALWSELFGTEAEKTTPRQAVALEAALKQTPDDLPTRKRLVDFYQYAAETPKNKAALLRHRLWFVEKHPEISNSDIFGYVSYFYAGEQGYEELKAAWLKQLTARRNDAEVRLNAAGFFENPEPEVAEKILAEGLEINPNNYEIAVKYFEILKDKIESETDENEEAKEAEEAETAKAGQIPVGKIRAKKTPEEKLADGVKAFEAGMKALDLIKRERSDTRDSARAELLPDLIETAFRAKKFTETKQLARELIREFGDDIKNRHYAQATHTGNTYLGLVALEESDIASAKNFLLISVRAPLRAKESFYFSPEISLAKKLLAKGEKQSVLEYLQLCEELAERHKEVLQKWQKEISGGKTPSFNFYERTEVEFRVAPPKVKKIVKRKR